MGKIILITGGASSGKSEFAEKICEQLEKPLNFKDRLSKKDNICCDIRNNYSYGEYIDDRLLKANRSNVVYIATGIPFDEELKSKKEKHVKRRKNKGWDTIEEYENLDKLFYSKKFDYEIVLIDCITMMISNLMFQDDVNFDAGNTENRNEKRKEILTEVEKFTKSIKSKKSDFILVTNEIGMGVLPSNKLSRFFNEVAGEINQILAEISDDVYLVVSGIPMKIK